MRPDQHWYLLPPEVEDQGGGFLFLKRGTRGFVPIIQASLYSASRTTCLAFQLNNVFLECFVMEITSKGQYKEADSDALDLWMKHPGLLKI